MRDRARENALHDRTIEACPRCGMAHDEWPDDGTGGFERDGVVYCCRGCGDGTGCTCGAAGAGEAARRRGRSA